jgi:tetratricopeptide (TPR) repeat protein
LLTTRRKSQLAIEYSYQVRSKSSATWVFWVHASNEARFEQSFRDIADQVKIPGRQDAKVNIFQLVENWLRDEKIGNWVCVLDNVDDDQLLCSVPVAGKRDPMSGSTIGSTKPLLEYVPRSRNGSIIITSRTREVALKMVHHSDLIEVKPMEQSEALELLQRKLEQPGETQESRQLVNALESMPLAIVQAASYIRNRAPRSSVSQYLKDFLGSDREATKLLKKEAGHLYRDWEAKNSILVTWQISFDYIRQTKPSAAQLLSLMSFFDRQGIPENLIRHQPKANYISSSELPSDSSDGETSVSDSGPDFEDDVATLRDYSFISIIENTTLFTMHRLVQLTTRAWLKSHGQIDQCKGEFISTLCDEFPTGEYENWERCRPLFPHVKSAMSQQPASPEYLLKWAMLLYRGAWYASQIGNITDARQMAFQSRNHRMILLGDEHEEAIDSTSMLATAYWNQGRWEEAEQLFVQVMETRKTKLGEDHPSTLISMANLASTFCNQGRWEEAEQLFVQVIEARTTKLGEDHPDTLSSMANLASTFRNQGRWEEAEQLFVQVIETSKTKLGEDHPDTLSMANLAFTWKSSAHDAKAINLLRDCVTKQKQTLGLNHPTTLSNSETLLEWEAERLNMNA